jgi:molecular chaperone DnaJ
VIAVERSQQGDDLDYYGVLGVPATASPAEVSRAYRRLVRALHPDTRPASAGVNADADVRRLAEVLHAYGVLGDAGRRAEYDRRRAEYDRHRAEQERRRAEQDRRRAEQDRRRAEQDRRRAEQDRRRAAPVRARPAGSPLGAGPLLRGGPGGPPLRAGPGAPPLRAGPVHRIPSAGSGAAAGPRSTGPDPIADRPQSTGWSRSSEPAGRPVEPDLADLIAQLEALLWRRFRW